jgi:hypothetical protein
MSARHERIRDERLFYCFVDFEHIRDEKPLVFVVPAEVVAKVLNASHKNGWQLPEDQVRNIKTARSESSFQAILIFSVMSNSRLGKDG